MHRTGSTLLQNLLAQDPNSRTTRFWEQMRTIPPAKTKEELVNNSRIDEVNYQLKQFSNKVCKGWYDTFLKMHYISAENPEEDVIILNSVFQQTIHAYMLYDIDNELPKLIRESGAYQCRFLHLFLKLQDHYLSPSSHWLLKNPNHSQYLNDFLGEFPKANIIVTHRDPVPVVGSWITFCGISSFYLLCNDFKKVSFLYFYFFYI